MPVEPPNEMRPPYHVTPWLLWTHAHSFTSWWEGLVPYQSPSPPLNIIKMKIHQQISLSKSCHAHHWWLICCVLCTILCWLDWINHVLMKDSNSFLVLGIFGLDVEDGLVAHLAQTMCGFCSHLSMILWFCLNAFTLISTTSPSAKAMQQNFQS